MARKKTRKRPPKGAREKFSFWLDIRKSEEFALTESISELKSRRSFSSAIRDGLRLICDLRAGRLDVLLELFPWVKSEILSAGQGSDDGPTGFELAQQLEKLERLLLSQNNGAIMQQALAPGPKPLAVSQPPAPTFDDDEPLVVKKAKATGTSAQTFLDAAFRLVQ